VERVRLLKNPFAPFSGLGSEAENAVFVVFWPCFWPLLDRRPGQQRLFQHAGVFSELGADPLWLASLAVLRATRRESRSEGRTRESMSAEENKAIMRRYFSVFKQGNIDLLDELLAPDYVNHTPAIPDLPTGPEGVKGVVSMFRSGMPDLRAVVEDMIAEGDKVATRYTLEGTHEGELFGVPPTGKWLSIKSISVERVSEGRIREHWRVTDSLEMMQQLGVVPEAGQEGVEPSH
jgi:steroid delta-isomerase-like uncharacterized protein